MCGFIAQLVEHRTGIAEVTGSNPVEALIFFRLLLSNCLNWKIYCDDHISLSLFCSSRALVLAWLYLRDAPKTRAMLVLYFSYWFNFSVTFDRRPKRALCDFKLIKIKGEVSEHSRLVSLISDNAIEIFVVSQLWSFLIERKEGSQNLISVCSRNEMKYLVNFSKNKCSSLHVHNI